MTATSIRYVETQPSLTGNIDGTLWQDAIPVPISQFLWCDPSQGSQTIVRPLYNDDTLFLQYQVDSRHIYADTTTLNGPVWEDSCVELFAAVDPARQDHYFNFEVNCAGTFHLGVGTDRTHRDLISPELAESIRINTSVSGTTKTPSDSDTRWWISVAIPFETLSAVTGTPVDPERGTTWRGNFHRIRSEPTPLFAAWNPVESPEPNFHQPSAFGELVFE